MSVTALNELLKNKTSASNRQMVEPTAKMPTLFVGHGSPMNAIAANDYTQRLKSMGQSIPRPKAILVISSHWLTKGTWVTSMEAPKTIHDFYGFPEELYKVQYNAPGSPQTSELVQEVVKSGDVQRDHNWGLDHGSWAVLRHMYPQGDIPVLQMSMDVNLTPEKRVQLGSELSALRDHGVLIIGSGNVVHNLRRIEWDENAKPYPWAEEFHDFVKTNLQKRDFPALTTGWQNSNAGRLSVPTTDHYDPLLYILGTNQKSDEISIEVDEIQNASVSMLSFLFT